MTTDKPTALRTWNSARWYVRHVTNHISRIMFISQQLQTWRRRCQIFFRYLSHKLRPRCKLSYNYTITNHASKTNGGVVVLLHAFITSTLSLVRGLRVYSVKRGHFYYNATWVSDTGLLGGARTLFVNRNEWRSVHDENTQIKKYM
jgi:hypothetical protein